MKANRNKYYLLNYVVMACVLILALNDHYLKFAFSNWFTGKLSDIVGIIVLPLLLIYLFPQLKRTSIVISAVLFIFWKSPVSQQFIDFFNKFELIQMSRVIDYSDLFVLLLLPVPYLIIKRIDELDFLKIKGINPLLILFPTILTLMATSISPTFFYNRSEGNLKCYKCDFIVNYNQTEIVDKLRDVGIVFDSIAPYDSVALDRMPRLKEENTQVYRINQLIIDKDTLRNLDFTMRTFKEGNKKDQTRIYFDGMEVSEDISNYKLEKKLRKYYKKLLLRELKSKLKR